jgi:hypothetical protein
MSLMVTPAVLGMRNQEVTATITASLHTQSQSSRPDCQNQCSIHVRGDKIEQLIANGANDEGNRLWILAKLVGQDLRADGPG